MKIERITDWGIQGHELTYPLYKATYKHFTTYGTSHLQALSNLLGILHSLRWDNYSTEHKLSNN